MLKSAGLMPMGTDRQRPAVGVDRQRAAGGVVETGGGTRQQGPHGGLADLRPEWEVTAPLPVVVADYLAEMLVSLIL